MAGGAALVRLAVAVGTKRSLEPEKGQHQKRNGGSEQAITKGEKKVPGISRHDQEDSERTMIRSG